MAVKRTDLMTVGELSRRTGVPVKNLRQYADWGLIYSAGRSESKYRLFDSGALWCVRCILEARRLGLTLAEIRSLTGAYLEVNGQPIGPPFAKLLKASRARVEAKIAELQETLRQIDEFESEHRKQLAGGGGAWWPGDPRASDRSA